MLAKAVPAYSRPFLELQRVPSSFLPIPIFSTTIQGTPIFRHHKRKKLLTKPARTVAPSRRLLGSSCAIRSLSPPCRRIILCATQKHAQNLELKHQCTERQRLCADTQRQSLSFSQPGYDNSPIARCHQFQLSNATNCDTTLLHIACSRNIYLEYSCASHPCG